MKLWRIVRTRGLVVVEYYVEGEDIITAIKKLNLTVNLSFTDGELSISTMNGKLVK